MLRSEAENIILGNFSHSAASTSFFIPLLFFKSAGGHASVSTSVVKNQEVRGKWRERSDGEKFGETWNFKCFRKQFYVLVRDVFLAETILESVVGP